MFAEVELRVKFSSYMPSYRRKRDTLQAINRADGMALDFHRF